MAQQSEGAARPRIFVVEDHPLVRRGIESVIGSEYDLVGSADEVGAAVELISERHPDLVLLDVHIEGGGGAAVVNAVRPVHPDIKYLVLSVSTSREEVLRMFQAGINGYIVKTSDEQFLLGAIEQTLAGARPVSREVAGHLLAIDDGVPEASGIERLTPKEREVTTLIARGYTYREVASSLSRPISIKTLESHIAHIFEKLGVASRHELTRLAFETGFVRPDSVITGDQ
jgi:DNA-binding NarL/FixJ family response regulator